MNGYLGEKIINIEDSEFKGYTSSEWALYFISTYGSIDGAHHKQEPIDQVARILNGTKVILKVASWDNGYTENRVSLDKESDTYKKWIKNEFGKNGEYDVGIAP